MKIYFDARCLASAEPVGVARYTVNILEALSAIQGLVLVGLTNRPINPAFKRLDVEYKYVPLLRFLPGTLFVLFLSHFFIEKQSVFMGFNHCIPIFRKCQNLNFLFIHDFVYRICPETQTRINRYMQSFSVSASLRLRSKLVFVSKYSRDEGARLYPEYVKGCELCVPPSIFRSRGKSGAFDGTHGPFLFALGSLEPRKNLVALIKAFEKLKVSGWSDLKLVLAGAAGWKTGVLRQAIEGSEFSQDISILGYIDDDDLDYLFKNCAVFCMPSFYEGFGLPQFEANAVGAKVVGSYYSELRYYKDYKGVFLFDYRVDNLTHIIQRSLNAEASVEKISLQPGVEELINAVRHAVDIR